MRKRKGVLKQNGDKPTSKDVSEKYREWCNTRSAVPYAVVLDGTTTIGCICLSRIDSLTEPTRIAGWIGSDFRGVDYGKAAIDQLLNEANSRGLSNVVISTVKDD